MARKLSLQLFSFLIFFIISLIHPSSSTTTSAGATVYSILDYGAKGDGKTDTTKPFLDAWNAACSKPGKALIYFPKGRYLLNPVEFNGGDCKSKDITIFIGGSLQAPENYRVLHAANNDIWISFHVVEGVKFVGGALDAKGSYLWRCKAEGGDDCSEGAASLVFTNSKNIEIRDVLSLNSQMFHMGINGCQDVKIQGVKIIAPGDSPNTDGIHVQYSDNVTIHKASIRTGDDCISVGPGTSSLVIEYISCDAGHGISIGSLARDAEEPGVQNVAVRNVVLSGTTNGLRIKSWARPCSGFVQGVLYQNVVMRNVLNPIFIDQHYCPHNLNCPGQESGVQVNHITYRNIRGTSATEVAVKFDCSSASRCTGITLDNVDLTYQNQQPAKSFCNNAHGGVIGAVRPTSCLQ